MKISMNSTLINKAPFTKKEGRKMAKKEKRKLLYSCTSKKFEIKKSFFV